MIVRTLPLFCLVLLYPLGAHAQLGAGDSPFERDFGDVRFLDAYFGVQDRKIEVSAGDQNVPLTVVMANVGNHDIIGVRGELSVPLGFSPPDGPGPVIGANSDLNPLAGENFALTFFVNIGEQTKPGNYPASVKVDYSRLRDSGTRNEFFDFRFKVTGDSVINMKAPDPFLTSLRTNHIVIEISNDGTAPVSGVDIELQNTQGTISSTSQSVTNTENVVILDSNWDIGHLDAGQTKYLELDVYVPESLKGDTLRAPMKVTYFNAHGDESEISRIVDFYIKGLIDISIYNVDIIDLSGRQTIIGEIINEGNEDALFGFVTVDPLGDSNIRSTTQFIDEIETDSPVPFNVPVEFDGEPVYGDHDILITVRYKDDLRDETLLTYEQTVHIEDLSEPEPETDYAQLGVLAAAAASVIAAVIILRRRRAARHGGTNPGVNNTPVSPRPPAQ